MKWPDFQRHSAANHTRIMVQIMHDHILIFAVRIQSLWMFLWVLMPFMCFRAVCNNLCKMLNCQSVIDRIGYYNWLLCTLSLAKRVPKTSKISDV